MMGIQGGKPVMPLPMPALPPLPPQGPGCPPPYYTAPMPGPKADGKADGKKDEGPARPDSGAADQSQSPAATPPANAMAGAFAQAPESGTAAPGSFAPQMLGDFLGYSTFRTFRVVSVLSDPFVPNYGSVTDTIRVQVPYATRGAFKIAENESPRPETRFYVNYNYFGTPRLDVVGINSFEQRFPNAADPTVAGPVAPVTDTRFRNFEIHRQTFGLEVTCLDGRGSVGLRLPLIQTNVDVESSVDTAAASALNGAPTTGVAGVLSGFDNSIVGDLTIVTKYVLLADECTGAILSGGLVLTVPTGPGAVAGDGSKIHGTLFQGYLGFLSDCCEDFFVHGFSSVVVSTDRREATFMFNDIGLGYYMFRGDPACCVSGLIPTVELHSNNPLDKRRGGPDQPFRFSDSLVVIGGLHILSYDCATLTVGAGSPVIGPKPYAWEFVAQLNFCF
jgi:hypothetical protein